MNNIYFESFPSRAAKVEQSRIGHWLPQVTTTKETTLMFQVTCANKLQAKYITAIQG